ncbi:MAG: glycoside hydrolase family 16 protein [Actinobacteria bacterium]|nr:glycoside hydrolase family 16 protein [Actinomycetota bacterium]
MMSPDVKSPPVVARRLLWAEDFDGPAGPAPTVAYPGASDSTDANWQPDIGDGSEGPGAGWGNNEAEYYTGDSVALDGSPQGNLVIAARKTRDDDGLNGWRENPNWQYISGKITTAGRLSFHYGLIEARIKVPTDPGSWSAFWLLGDGLRRGVHWPQCGEIDILESVGYEPEHLLGTIHGPGYSADAGVTRKIHAGAPLSDDFHTYAILWLPDSITWFFDDRAYHHLTPSDIDGHEWVFNQSFYMILNLAMGGNLGGPLDPEVINCELLVDYVRHSAVQVTPDGPFIGSLIRH